MEDYNAIAHLDFDTPADMASDIELIQFEPFEHKRLQLIQTFIDRVCELDERLGEVNLTDPDAYFDRLTQLEILMRDDMEDFGLEHGDLIQANVPNIIYPAGLGVVQLAAGEVVRARFEGLSIHSHYQVDADNQAAETLAFGMNIAISEPTVIGHSNIKVSAQSSEMYPLVSLHHPSVNLHRVNLPY